MMNDRRKSDRPVVVTKSSNKATEVAAERMERRGLAKGKTPRQNTDRSDAERLHNDLEERFAKFRLKLHPEKTRLIEFGYFAANNRRRRGQGKPETFNFLGFTHICGKKRSNGMFTVYRRTISKRDRAKLKEIKEGLRRRMHQPVP